MKTPRKGRVNKKKITIGKSVALVLDPKPKLTLNQKIKKVARKTSPLRIDQWNAGGSIPSTGVLISNLGNITYSENSSDLGTRQETKAYLKHFKCRGTFSVQTLDDNNRVRVLVLKSKTGRPFNIAEVMYEGANAPTLLMDGQVNNRNFDVISDKQMTFQEQDGGSVRPEYRTYTKSIKLDQIAKFNEMASMTAEQPLNKGAQIYMCAFSDSGTAPHPPFRLTNQVTFYNN